MDVNASFIEICYIVQDIVTQLLNTPLLKYGWYSWDGVMLLSEPRNHDVSILLKQIT